MYILMQQYHDSGELETAFPDLVYHKLIVPFMPRKSLTWSTRNVRLAARHLPLQSSLPCSVGIDAPWMPVTFRERLHVKGPWNKCGTAVSNRRTGGVKCSGILIQVGAVGV
jgi:hypothetical protein